MITDARLMALIEQLYDAAVNPEGWKHFVDAVSDAFRGPAALFLQDLDRLDANIFHFARFDPKAVQSYVDHYGATNPVIQRQTGLPQGAVVSDSGDLVPRPEYESCEWYQDWCRPQGLYHWMNGNIIHQEALTTNLAFMRPKEEGDYTPDEVSTYRRLLPHVQRAVQVHRQLFKADFERSGALQALESLGLGVVAVDAGSRILFANAVAERIFRRGQGLKVLRGHLSATPALQREMLARLIHAAATLRQSDAANTGGVLSLPAGDGPPISLMVSPFRAQGVDFGLGIPAAIVFMNDPDRVMAPGPQRLVALYSLTKAEAKLVDALLTGVQLSEYAELAGITIATARSQLKQIFAKTGVSRQSELMRLVLSNSVLHLGGR